jgi:hypothetical protein
MFENWVLRKMLRSKRDDVEESRGTCNEELHELYSSPNIIWVIKSRKMSWTQHVACIGGGGRGGEVCPWFWWGNLRKDHLAKCTSINRRGQWAELRINLS